MADKTVTPRSGNVRLTVQTMASGRATIIGPFGTLGGARRLAEDLIMDGAVRSALVSHRNRGTWKPAWSFHLGQA